MSMVTAMIGRTGEPLPEAAADLLSDGDARTVLEPARWAGSVVRITRRGRLVRATDLGHDCTRPGGLCCVCGQCWPCSSRVLEAVAMGDLL